jgi:putative transposase
MSTLSPDRYKNHRFPAEIISHGVWLYFRFCLSYAMWRNACSPVGLS